MATRTSMRAESASPRDENAASRTTSRVRVVAIGASAGGLEAFTELITAIPEDTALAFVLIQHLDPSHDSMLTKILAGATPIPVQEVTDGMRIERRRVYVIPPDTQMTIEGDVLRLAPRTPKVPAEGNCGAPKGQA